MDQTAKDLLLKTIIRMPEWVRHDLAGKDAATRLRAEESLAAMLIAAVEQDVPLAD